VPDKTSGFRHINYYTERSGYFKKAGNQKGKNMKRILLLGLIIWSSSQAIAQQSAHYTQYIFSGLIINPAYAGSKEVLNISGTYRSQWAGLEGAPTTQTLSLDGAVMKNNIGLGFTGINDQIGAQGQKSFNVSVAFRVKVGPEAKMALGFSGGASEYYTDGTRLIPIDGIHDSAIPTTKESSLLPDARAGFFLNTSRFYLGLSASNLIAFQNKYQITPAPHYFLTSGYVFELNQNLKFKPSFLVKEDFKSPTNLDVNAFLLIGNRVWLGGSYRSSLDLLKQYEYQDSEQLSPNNAWALLTELYMSPRLKIGYSYDVTLTSLRGHASHEISLGIYFYKKEDSRSLTIRYF